jgi:electron transport complex protein RnfG
MNDLSKAESIDVEVYAEPGIGRITVRTAGILLIFTLIFTALMAGAYNLTAPLLAASAKEEKLRMISEVLPRTLYDNELLADAVWLAPITQLNTETDTQVFRARRGNDPIALVVEFAANDGYSGRIELILAVDANGQMLAQRVTHHKETPGLGDYIDPKKDKNKQRPWITQFNNLGFEDVPMAQWRVRKDGGRFDQMNGATISARAVTNASRRALEWIVANKDALFEQTKDSRFTATASEGQKP